MISVGSGSNSGREWIMEDGMGNIRFTSNSSGNEASQTDYDPFGNKRYDNSIPPKYQFQEQYLDEESDMYYMRARYYDPVNGQFISRDPIDGMVNNPQTQNPYAYALNNPINLSDPSGEMAIGLCVSANLGAGIYGTCSFCIGIAKDSNSSNWGTGWQAGPIASVGGGGVAGVASGVGVTGFVTNANNFEQIAGRDTFAGGSAWAGGIDVAQDHDDPSIKTFSGGFTPGPDVTIGGVVLLPVEIHGGASYSWAFPWISQ